MKVKVNLRDYLEDNAGAGISVQARVDTDDILESLDLPDEDEFDFDIDQALEVQRQVAVIWTTDHVQEIRPDLSEDQSWEVLKTCRARWGSCQGIDWQVIEKTADEQYGPKPTRRWHGRIYVAVEGYSYDEAIEHFTDLAAHIEKDAVNFTTRATFDTASLRPANPSNSEQA